jgi:hypothetical protein
MHDERSGTSSNNLLGSPADTLSVVRVDPSDFDAVARVLALAYVNDPIHIWAMPNAATRLNDATVFFKLYLRWMRPDNRDVFATSDGSSVLITSIARKGEGAYPDGIRHLPPIIRKRSPVNDYFQWIESFRPNIDHRHAEFIGTLPNASRPTGYFLLTKVFKMIDLEGLPIWTWSSNPINLPMYRRAGYIIGEELRRDSTTPPVHILWRPPMPLTNEGERSHKSKPSVTKNATRGDGNDQ